MNIAIESIFVHESFYFLRHGAADWPDWNKPDDERPLTKEGGRELHKVGEFLARLKANPDLILTSPLPRAVETADIAAEHLRVRVHEEKLLAPGFMVDRFEASAQEISATGPYASWSRARLFVRHHSPCPGGSIKL